jgi:hypothetical protein
MHCSVISNSGPTTKMNPKNMSTVRGPCPNCNRGLKDNAMAITTDERGVVCYCHRCGYAEARNHDDPVVRRDFLSTRTTRTTAKTEALEWSTKAQSIWDP